MSTIESDNALREELEVSAFVSRQQRKVQSASAGTGIRIHHKPSGIKISCEQFDTQLANYQTCITKLKQRLANTKDS